MSSVDRENQIRKLRKKLRQIEKLERLDRALVYEEQIKVSRKDLVRDSLLEYLVGISSTADNSLESEAYLSIDDTSEIQKYSEDIQSENDSYHAAEFEDINFDNNNSADIQPDVKETTEIRSPAGVILEDKPIKETKIKKKKGQKTHDWSRPKFVVTYLEGHNDVVTALDTDGSILLTASRDTTVKVWDVLKLKEVKNLAGHTGSVTSVTLLSEDDSKKLCTACEVGYEKLVVSSSLDCSFKLWSLNKGRMIKSVYTYNPITKLVVISSKDLFITASDGGKLELWDFSTLKNISAVNAHDEPVTQMQVESSLVYTGSADGTLKVHELREKSLHCIFVSENIKTVHGAKVCPRYVRSLAVNKSMAFYGDDGVNIKALDWKKGQVQKLANHTQDFGCTDAAYISGDFLLCSSYDMDNGMSTINVRRLQDYQYLFTVDDEDTDRIQTLTCHLSSNNKLLLVTGGVQLKIWRQLIESESDEDAVCANVQPLSEQPIDSDIESDDDMSDNDDLDIYRRDSTAPDAEQGSWFAWCNIL